MGVAERPQERRGGAQDFEVSLCAGFPLELRLQPIHFCDEGLLISLQLRQTRAGAGGTPRPIRLAPEESGLPLRISGFWELMEHEQQMPLGKHRSLPPRHGPDPFPKQLGHLPRTGQRAHGAMQSKAPDLVK